MARAEGKAEGIALGRAQALEEWRPDRAGGVEYGTGWIEGYMYKAAEGHPA